MRGYFAEFPKRARINTNATWYLDSIQVIHSCETIRSMVLLTAIEIMIEIAISARVVDGRLYIAVSRVDGLFVLEYPLVVYLLFNLQLRGRCHTCPMKHDWMIHRVLLADPKYTLAAVMAFAPVHTIVQRLIFQPGRFESLPCS
jgi:hypothetical protein